ncbi:MAG: hypothetical protein KJ052_07365 [Candidatus Hydrogenedentes bacterium]|nr:hypothetical protein [Candidatus Hydrogenedentota bacterium]
MGIGIGRLYYPVVVVLFMGAALIGCGREGGTSAQTADGNPPAASNHAAADGLSVSVDSATSEVTVVAGGQGRAGLQSILDQAYDEDGETTGKVVRKWVADRDVLDANDIRDLLEDSWNQDPEGTTQVIRPWFVQRASLEVGDIPALLDKAWKYDSADTRETLGQWGADKGFVDVEDPDSLAKYDLVSGRNLAQIKNAIQTYHNDKWNELLNLAQETSPELGRNRVLVSVSWAFPNAISRGLLRFSEGDERFLQRMNSAVTLGPVNDPEATIQIVVEYPIEMPEDRVQVQDADFVNLVTTMRGQDMPERDSQAWNDALKVGVVSGYVYL